MWDEIDKGGTGHTGANYGYLAERALHSAHRGGRDLPTPSTGCVTADAFVPNDAGWPEAFEDAYAVSAEDVSPFDFSLWSLSRFAPLVLCSSLHVLSNSLHYNSRRIATYKLDAGCYSACLPFLLFCCFPSFTYSSDTFLVLFC